MKADSSGRVKVSEKFKRLVSEGKIESGDCTHLSEIQDVSPSSEGCAKCLQLNDVWVNLRLCLTCGHVGCCDNSKNKHATKHYHETKHPMIASYEIGEEWLWCYMDEATFSP